MDPVANAKGMKRGLEPGLIQKCQLQEELGPVVSIQQRLSEAIGVFCPAPASVESLVSWEWVLRVWGVNCHQYNAKVDNQSRKIKEAFMEEAV